MSSASLQAALRALHYIFPILILAYYFITQSIFICTLRGFRSQDHNIQYKRLVVVQAAVLVLYTIELLQLVFETLLNHSASASPDSIVSPYRLFVRFNKTLLMLKLDTINRSMLSLAFSYGVSLLPPSLKRETKSYGIHSGDHGSSLSLPRPYFSALRSLRRHLSNTRLPRKFCIYEPFSRFFA